MDKLFETAIFTRKALLQILDNLSVEQMARIPKPHRNSIFWNVAHLLVTQQLILYRLSGLPMPLEEDFVQRYQKGSVAREEVPEEDMAFVRENLVPLCEQIKTDYSKGLFQKFSPYMTSTGIELTSFEDAIEFSAFHDGIHLGVVLSIKKLVE